VTYPRPCETTGGCTRGAEEAAGPGTAPARRRTKTFRGRVPLSLSLPLRTTKKPMGKSERVARGPRRARAEPSRGRGGGGGVHVEREKYHQSERAEREEVRAGACPLAGTLPCRPHPTALPLPARLRPPIRLATPPAGSRCPCPPTAVRPSPHLAPLPSPHQVAAASSTAQRAALLGVGLRRSAAQSPRASGTEGKRHTASQVKGERHSTLKERPRAAAERREREKHIWRCPLPPCLRQPTTAPRPSSPSAAPPRSTRKSPASLCSPGTRGAGI
jgi:hypothetical protein